MGLVGAVRVERDEVGEGREVGIGMVRNVVG